MFMFMFTHCSIYPETPALLRAPERGGGDRKSDLRVSEGCSGGDESREKVEG
jgi:hypothetical protein